LIYFGGDIDFESPFFPRRKSLIAVTIIAFSPPFLLMEKLLST
jgi:hypothetical protein